MFTLIGAIVALVLSILSLAEVRVGDADLTTWGLLILAACIVIDYVSGRVR